MAPVEVAEQRHDHHPEAPLPVAADGDRGDGAGEEDRALAEAGQRQTEEQAGGEVAGQVLALEDDDRGEAGGDRGKELDPDHRLEQDRVGAAEEEDHDRRRQRQDRPHPAARIDVEEEGDEAEADDLDHGEGGEADAEQVHRPAEDQVRGEDQVAAVGPDEGFELREATDLDPDEFVPAEGQAALEPEDHRRRDEDRRGEKRPAEERRVADPPAQGGHPIGSSGRRPPRDCRRAALGGEDPARTAREDRPGPDPVGMAARAGQRHRRQRHAHLSPRDPGRGPQLRS